MARALILVDIQNDFMPDGALPVPAGPEVIAIANMLALRFDIVVATQDWHPADHGSFASLHEGRTPGEVIELAGLSQMLWPDHCVANTKGAELVEELDTSRIDAVFRKGSDRNVDSYSGFFDNGRRENTGLAAWLDARGVAKVFILGVATDYCVKATALDAVSLGYETTLVVDACRGVNLEEGDVSAALSELEATGVVLVRSDEVSSRRD